MVINTVVGVIIKYGTFMQINYRKFKYKQFDVWDFWLGSAMMYSLNVYLLVCLLFFFSSGKLETSSIMKRLRRIGVGWLTNLIWLMRRRRRRINNAFALRSAKNDDDFTRKWKKAKIMSLNSGLPDGLLISSHRNHIILYYFINENETGRNVR